MHFAWFRLQTIIHISQGLERQKNIFSNLFLDILAEAPAVVAFTYSVST